MQTEFHLRTQRKEEILDITERVRAFVAESGVDEGLCSVWVAHATAAVVVNENADPNVGLDVLDALGRLVPEGGWRHDRIDDNAAAHIKASILGPSETIPVRAGKLLLGTWQTILVVELDGPKERRVVLTVR